MLLKFKKTNERAVLPCKNHKDDTGLDVTSVEDKVVPARGSAVVDVGLEFAHIDSQFWVKIEGRSGMGFKSYLIQVLSIAGIEVMLVLSYTILQIKIIK